MNRYMKRTALLALTGALCISGFTGCGKKEEAVEPLDAAETVAEVDGEAIPAGILSFMAHYQQIQTDLMYQSLMGTSATDMWDTVADEETGETYGEQSVKEILTQLEKMYLLRAHAEEYEVSLTEEETEAAAAAASEFAETNGEEVLAELGTSEEHIAELLELATYESKMREPVVANTDREVSDEEAQQTSLTYVRLAVPDEEDEKDTAQDDAEEGDAEPTKDDLQKVLEKMLEDPSADMDEVAKEINSNFMAIDSHYTTNDEEDTAVPDEVKKALETLDDGAMVSEMLETEDYYYVVRLDARFDEEDTEAQRESIISQRENEHYTEVTEGWLSDAEIEVKEDTLKKIKITSSHAFVAVAPSASENAEVHDHDHDAEAQETEIEDTDMEAADDMPEDEGEMEEIEDMPEDVEDIPVISEDEEEK